MLHNRNTTKTDEKSTLRRSIYGLRRKNITRYHEPMGRDR
jgi:hypothetical protein